MFSIELDAEARAHLDALRGAARELDGALAEFTTSVAEAVGAEVRAVSGAVEGVDYGNLEVAYFGRVGGWEVSALVLPDTVRRLTSDDEWRTVVTVVSGDQDDALHSDMTRLSPWPVELLPPFVQDMSVRLVSRRVTVQEVDAQVRRVLGDQRGHDLLVEWGHIRGPWPHRKKIRELEKLAFPEGLEVHEDVAWRVLRQEYGLGGERSVPHWRRAVRSAGVDVSRVLLEGFWSRLLGEDSSRLPERNVELAGKMGGVERFQEFVSSRGAATRSTPR